MALLRSLGNKLGVATALHNLGTLARDRGDLAEAAARFRETLALRWDLGDQPGVASSLAGVAKTAAAMRLPRRAVRLYGAAASVREAIGAHRIPGDDTDPDLDLADIRPQMDAADFAAAWAEGRALSWEETVAEALAFAREFAAGANEPAEL